MWRGNFFYPNNQNERSEKIYINDIQNNGKITIHTNISTNLITLIEGGNRLKIIVFQECITNAWIYFSNKII